MFSKLVDCRSEVRSKDGNTYYVCTFSQTRGDKDAKTFIEKEVNGVKIRVLNTSVASIRTIDLVKCLFPTEDDNAKLYAKELKRFVKCCESDNGEYTTSKGEKVTKESCTFYLPLIYVTMPVKDVFPDITHVYYQGKDNKEHILTEFNAVGYSKLDSDFNDTDIWDDVTNGATQLEYIKRNALNNLNNGTYYLTSIAGIVEDETDSTSVETDFIDDDE